MTREIPDHINPMQWQQALGAARQISARVFSDGGTPMDALVSMGLSASHDITWEKAVNDIAGELCAHPLSMAA